MVNYLFGTEPVRHCLSHSNKWLRKGMPTVVTKVSTKQDTKLMIKNAKIPSSQPTNTHLHPTSFLCLWFFTSLPFKTSAVLRCYFPFGPCKDKVNRVHKERRKKMEVMLILKRTLLSHLEWWLIALLKIKLSCLAYLLIGQLLTPGLLHSSLFSFFLPAKNNGEVILKTHCYVWNILGAIVMTCLLLNRPIIISTIRTIEHRGTLASSCQQGLQFGFPIRTQVL